MLLFASLFQMSDYLGIVYENIFMHVVWQVYFSPQLHYLRLPKDISDNHVILMDATVATGAAGKKWKLI